MIQRQWRAASETLAPQIEPNRNGSAEVAS
jgi:hypothetical protein